MSNINVLLFIVLEMKNPGDIAIVLLKYMLNWPNTSLDVCELKFVLPNL